MTSVPPCSDLASPIDEICTSTRFPERANGGSVAVTTTAAAFFTRTCRGSTEIVHAAPAQHAQDALHGEERLLAVAGAVEADDDAVAGQLVAAHAFDVGDVLDAGGAPPAPARSERSQSDQRDERDVWARRRGIRMATPGRGASSPSPGAA